MRNVVYWVEDVAIQLKTTLSRDCKKIKSTTVSISISCLLSNQLPQAENKHNSFPPLNTAASAAKLHFNLQSGSDDLVILSPDSTIASERHKRH